MELAVVLLLGVVGAVVVIWSLPRMLLDGVLSGTEAALFACGMVALIAIAGALVRPCPAASASLVSLFVFGLSIIPFIRYRLRGRGLTRLGNDTIERCQRTIAFDERNTGARLMLAEAFREQGRYSEAIAAFEAVLEREEGNARARRGLDDCLNLQRASSGEVWLCHVCRAENDPEVTQCARCRTPRARGSVRPSGLRRWTIWVASALQACVVVLLVAGAMNACPATVLSLVIAAGMYGVYMTDPDTE